MSWVAAVLLAAAGGYLTVSLLSKPGPSSPCQADDIDPALVRDLRVIENMRQYDKVDDVRFLRQLDDPDLFGDDAGS